MEDRLRERLAALVEAEGSQRRVAAKIGVHQTTIHKFLRHKTGLSLPFGRRLAAAYPGLERLVNAIFLGRDMHGVQVGTPSDPAKVA